MAELKRPSKVAAVGSTADSRDVDVLPDSKISPTDVEPTSATTEAVLDPNESLAFAAVGEKIGATTRKLEKVELLKTYFAALAPETLAPAAVAFTGRPFPSADGRTLNCGWAIIKAALLAISGHDGGRLSRDLSALQRHGRHCAGDPAGPHAPRAVAAVRLAALLRRAGGDARAARQEDAPAGAARAARSGRGEIPAQDHHRRSAHRAEGRTRGGGARRRVRAPARGDPRGQHAERRPRRDGSGRARGHAGEAGAAHLQPDPLHARESRADGGIDRRAAGRPDLGGGEVRRHSLPGAQGGRAGGILFARAAAHHGAVSGSRRAGAGNSRRLHRRRRTARVAGGPCAAVRGIAKAAGAQGRRFFSRRGSAGIALALRSDRRGRQEPAQAAVARTPRAARRAAARPAHRARAVPARARRRGRGSGIPPGAPTW